MSAQVIALAGRVPTLDPTAWVAPGATVVGEVTLAAGSSVWYAAVLRADGAAISIGERSNVQDGCVVHADTRGAVELGPDVSVGHRAVLHGCTVERGSLIGMGAVVLTGARVGAESLVAAGAVLREGMQVPPRSLVAGVPAQVRRTLTDEEVEGLLRNAEAYLHLTDDHRSATTDPDDHLRGSADAHL